MTHVCRLQPLRPERKRERKRGERLTDVKATAGRLLMLAVAGFEKERGWVMRLEDGGVGSGGGYDSAGAMLAVVFVFLFFPMLAEHTCLIEHDGST